MLLKEVLERLCDADLDIVCQAANARGRGNARRSTRQKALFDKIDMQSVTRENLVMNLVDTLTTASTFKKASNQFGEELLAYIDASRRWLESQPEHGNGIIREVGYGCMPFAKAADEIGMAAASTAATGNATMGRATIGSAPAGKAAISEIATGEAAIGKAAMEDLVHNGLLFRINHPKLGLQLAVLPAEYFVLLSDWFPETSILRATHMYKLEHLQTMIRYINMRFGRGIEPPSTTTEAGAYIWEFVMKDPPWLLSQLSEEDYRVLEILTLAQESMPIPKIQDLLKPEATPSSRVYYWGSPTLDDFLPKRDARIEDLSPIHRLAMLFLIVPVTARWGQLEATICYEYQESIETKLRIESAQRCMKILRQVEQKAYQPLRRVLSHDLGDDLWRVAVASVIVTPSPTKSGALSRTGVSQISKITGLDPDHVDMLIALMVVTSGYTAIESTERFWDEVAESVRDVVSDTVEGISKMAYALSIDNDLWNECYVQPLRIGPGSRNMVYAQILRRTLLTCLVALKDIWCPVQDLYSLMKETEEYRYIDFVYTREFGDGRFTNDPWARRTAKDSIVSPAEALPRLLKHFWHLGVISCELDDHADIMAVRPNTGMVNMIIQTLDELDKEASDTLDSAMDDDEAREDERRGRLHSSQGPIQKYASDGMENGGTREDDIKKDGAKESGTKEYGMKKGGAKKEGAKKGGKSEGEHPTTLHVLPTYEIIAPIDTRFDVLRALAAFCEPQQVDKTVRFRITQGTLIQAGASGTDLGKSLDFLRKHSATPVPDTLVILFKDIEARTGQIKIGRAGGYVIFRTPELLQQAMSMKPVSKFVLKQVGDKAVVLTQDANLNELQRLLVRKGLAATMEE